MIGKLLCRIGWHEFRYKPYPEYNRDGRRCSREQAAHIHAFGENYCCLRCGERP